MYCNRAKNYESEVSESDSHIIKEALGTTPRVRRRDFIIGTSAGLLGTMLALNSPFVEAEQRGSEKGKKDAPATKAAKVALVKGDSRYDNIYQSLKMIEQDIKVGIGDRQVIIKPNNVMVDRPLAATHLDCLAAILDVVAPMCQKPIIIAESPADKPAPVGFENYGYTKLQKEYNVRLLDLDNDEPSRFFILSRNHRPMPILVSSMMMDANIYLISAAVMKTHDTVIATLSLKNILMGAPLKTKETHYKQRVHQGIKEINYSFFLMAQRLKPSLSIIDGFQGMEGNGPVDGTAVDAKVAIAGTDFLAVDRVGVEVMGIDFSTIGYLNYCAAANLGVADLDRIKILGESIDNCRRPFQLHQNVAHQYKWRGES